MYAAVSTGLFLLGCSDRVIIDSEAPDYVIKISASGGSSYKGYVSGGLDEYRKFPHSCGETIVISTKRSGGHFKEKVRARACSETSRRRMSKIVVDQDLEVIFLPRRDR